MIIYLSAYIPLGSLLGSLLVTAYYFAMQVNIDLVYRVDKIHFSFGNIHDTQILAQKSHSLIMSAYIPHPN